MTQQLSKQVNTIAAAVLGGAMLIAGTLLGHNISDNSWSATATQEARNADATVEKIIADATATEEAFWIDTTKVVATDAAISATDNAVALMTATESLALTLTADVFYEATQYARFLDNQSCPKDKLKIGDDGLKYCDRS